MAFPAFALILHSHMPYVRRNGDWPVGEEWLLEAWAESYLPLWRLVDDLASGALPGKLALTMTPVLAEQLQDGYMEERLDWYLRNKIAHTLLEIERLEGMGDEPRRRLASYYGDFYRGLLRDYEERFRGRMMEVLSRAMHAGAVEVLASAATHAHLPSLGSDRNRRAQIEIGMESYRSCFGRDPLGFWLPECSYAPYMDEVLSGFSPPLTYTVLDFTAREGAPSGQATWQPHRLGSTPLVALLRDGEAHHRVWTMRGYPAGGDYREFAKRDYEGHGFQYWRITSESTPLDEKDVYHPERAAERAHCDARDFAADVERRLDEIAAAGGGADIPALVLAAYDTELLGHWWWEGPLWLREVLLLLEGRIDLPCRAAAQAAAGTLTSIAPAQTAWNVDGTFSTWVNPATADMWQRVHGAERDLDRLISRHADDPRSARALVQAARELLLMEASDWSFMVTRDNAAAYARDRLSSHHARFSAVSHMLSAGRVDAGALAALEETDNLFPWLTLRHWR